MESVRLTTRERQVIALLGEGLSNKEIATRLHIAVHTVKSHVHNVLEKLALRSRLEVAAFSHAAGGGKALEPQRHSPPIMAGAGQPATRSEISPLAGSALPAHA